MAARAIDAAFHRLQAPEKELPLLQWDTSGRPDGGFIVF